MRRKKKKANQNVMLLGLPVRIVNQIEATERFANAAKFAQIFIIIDELRTGL